MFWIFAIGSIFIAFFVFIAFIMSVIGIYITLPYLVFILLIAGHTFILLFKGVSLIEKLLWRGLAIVIPYSLERFFVFRWLKIPIRRVIRLVVKIGEVGAFSVAVAEFLALLVPLIIFWINLGISMWLLITMPFKNEEAFITSFYKVDYWFMEKTYYNTGHKFSPFIVDDIMDLFKVGGEGIGSPSGDYRGMEESLK